MLKFEHAVFEIAASVQDFEIDGSDSAVGQYCSDFATDSFVDVVDC